MTTFQDELLHLRRLLNTGPGREQGDRIENTEIVLDELLAALQGREEQPNKPVVIPDKLPTKVLDTIEEILMEADAVTEFYSTTANKIWQAISQHLRTL